MRPREDLHWCLCDGHVILLDLAADRYFGLAADAEASFLRAIAGVSLPEDARALQRLVEQGLLVEEAPAGAECAASRALLRPTGDLVECRGAGGGLARIVRAILLEMLFSWQLGHLPLSQVARKAASRPRHDRRQPANAAERVRKIVASFRTISPIFPEAERCLPRGLAVHASCCREGIQPNLVIGVRLNPFRAHCWVQLGDRVVVGDFEQVRLFTPIAVLA